MFLVNVKELSRVGAVLYQYHNWNQSADFLFLWFDTRECDLTLLFFPYLYLHLFCLFLSVYLDMSTGYFSYFFHNISDFFTSHLLVSPFLFLYVGRPSLIWGRYWTNCILSVGKVYHITRNMSLIFVDMHTHMH